MILCYEKLLEEFREDFKKISPQKYGYYLQRKAFFEIISGKRILGLKTLINSLIYNFNSEGLILIFSALFFPKKIIIEIAKIRKNTR